MVLSLLQYNITACNTPQKLKYMYNIAVKACQRTVLTTELKHWHTFVNRSSS